MCGEQQLRARAWELLPIADHGPRVAAPYLPCREEVADDIYAVELVAEIGRGGQGVVYKGLLHGLPVAIKVRAGTHATWVHSPTPHTHTACGYPRRAFLLPLVHVHRPRAYDCAGAWHAAFSAVRPAPRGCARRSSFASAYVAHT